MEKLWEEREVIRFSRGSKLQSEEENCVRELPFTVYLNGSEVATLLCTPADLEDLALGFLFSEGLITRDDGIESVEVNSKEGAARVKTSDGNPIAKRLYGKRTVTSGCGAGTSFYRVTDAWLIRPVKSDFAVKASDLSNRMRDLSGASSVYRVTRGVHAAASASPQEIMVLKDDIGRHNAVDKVAGDMLRNGWDSSRRMLLITGRVSSEMVIKAARMRCPLVASRASATDLAVNMAQEAGITLVAFARGDNLAVFSWPERVLEG